MIEATWESLETGKVWTDTAESREALEAARHEAAAHGIRLVDTRTLHWSELLARAESPDL